MFDLSDFNIFLNGGLFLVVAWALRKSFRNQRRIRDRNPLGEAQHELSKIEQSQFNRLNQLEIKLYEYGREVEARTDDRLRILDELLQEADREINRLRQQLALTQQEPNDSPLQSGPDILMYEGSDHISVTAEQRSMIGYLNQAGFSAQEISNCFTFTLTEIEVILAEANNPPQTDVA